MRFFFLFLFYFFNVVIALFTKPGIPQAKNRIVRCSNNQQGFTLVELVIFIVGLGIVMSTLLLPLVLSLQSSSKGFYSLAAYEIAKGRMELIRMQSRTKGFVKTADMCASSSPAVCSISTPTAYKVTSVISAAPYPNHDTTQYKKVTVVVQGNSSVGNGYAQLVSMVANY